MRESTDGHTNPIGCHPPAAEFAGDRGKRQQSQRRDDQCPQQQCAHEPMMLKGPIERLADQPPAENRQRRKGGEQVMKLPLFGAEQRDEDRAEPEQQ